jgi:hypothetical protein
MGLKMQNTTKLLMMELGMSLQPFQEEYAACHHWVTHTWVKVVIEIADLPVHPPRERDSWLMQELTWLN